MAQDTGHLPKGVLARPGDQRLGDSAKAKRDRQRDAAGDEEKVPPAEQVRRQAGAERAGRGAKGHEDQYVRDGLLPDLEGEAIRKVDQRRRKDAAGNRPGGEAGHQQCGEVRGEGRQQVGDRSFAHAGDSVEPIAA